MSPMSMPKGNDEVREAFRALVPTRAGVTTKPMFGHLAAFLNGNMFAGTFGEDLFVRVGDTDREKLLAGGGRDFAPMPGRAMRGNVVLPDGWRRDPNDARQWVAAALDAAGSLPPKAAKSRKK